MSDYKLKTHVHVVEVNEAGKRTGREQVFGPNDDMNASDNEWALSAISNPDVWEGEKPPASEPRALTFDNSADDRVSRLEQLIERLLAVQLGGAAAPAADGETKVPPRQGPGSGAAAWRAYAASRKVEVGEDASRDDVIAALEAAGKPTN